MSNMMRWAWRRKMPPWLKHSAPSNGPWVVSVCARSRSDSSMPNDTSSSCRISLAMRRDAKTWRKRGGGGGEDLQLALPVLVGRRLPDAVPCEVGGKEAAGGVDGGYGLVADLCGCLENVEGHAASECLAEDAGLVLEYRGVAAVAVEAQDVQQATAGTRGHGQTSRTVKSEKTARWAEIRNLGDLHANRLFWRRRRRRRRALQKTGRGATFFKAYFSAA
jgi:hypothetical protein